MAPKPHQRQRLTDRSDISLTVGEDTPQIPVAQIRIDGGTQMRAGLDEATIAEYAEVLRAQDSISRWSFPPVVVYHDGEAYWLGDGFHRLAAMRQVLRFEQGDANIVHRVPALVKSGTRRDAILHAAGANAEHGLRRTNADKRRAVETLLNDEEWAAWSDREIARRCRVSNQFVSNMRKALSVNDGQIDTARQVERGGKTYTMETRGIRDAAQVDKPAEPTFEPKPARVVYAEAPAMPAQPSQSAAPPATCETTDLPDGYTLRQTPRGWRWRRELTEGTVLMGDYCETEAGAVESAHRDWADRQARKAARTVYVEQDAVTTQDATERPKQYTIILDPEAYAALRTAVRHGALAMRMRREVKDRIQAAIDGAESATL